MDKVKWLDIMETALVRAEGTRKDIDLILVMRAMRDFLEEEVRNESGERKRKGDDC